MHDELLDKILSEISSWKELVNLLKQYSSSPYSERVLNIILKKANGLSYELLDENLSNTPLRDVAEILNIDLKKLFEICHDSFLGNLIWIYRLTKNNGGIIDQNNIFYLPYLLKLKYIDEIYFAQPEFGRKILVRLTTIPEEYKNINIDEVLDALRVLFYLNLLELDEELIKSFKNLLELSQNAREREVFRLIEIIEKCDIKNLLETYEELTGKKAKNIDEVNLREFYQKLIEIGCPVFFRQDKIRYNGVVYNGNFFPMKYKDKNGITKIIPPFKQVPLESVQKIHHPIKDIWLIPTEIFGKITLDEIYSFREVKKVKSENIGKELVKKIEVLSEDEIEEKIRTIVGEPGHTEHGPLEIVDVYLCKLKINNEEDLRNAGIIIKKRGTGKKKQITLRDIANQIIKAVNNDTLDLIIIIHIAQLADDVRDHFINLCNKLNKMYCIIDKQELARLFKAYGLI